MSSFTLFGFLKESLFNFFDPLQRGGRASDWLVVSKQITTFPTFIHKN
jgi:hypothetical protein